MRITLTIDDAVLDKAVRLTGVRRKASLVRMGLESLIGRESAKRLSALGGTEPHLRPVPRSLKSRAQVHGRSLNKEMGARADLG